MSPLSNLSSSHDSSSNSTTPPSEATLAGDESLISDAILPPPRQSQINPALRAQILLGHSDRLQEDCSVQAATNPTAACIDTDYESSANEDSEVYTKNKYDNADYALLSYARTNKINKIQRLLSAELRGEVILNLNFKGQQKQNFSWSALHLACYFGHLKIVELLLSNERSSKQIDINIQNNSGDTPLHKAALTRRIGIVQLLLSHGANVFIRNSDGLLAKQLTTDEHVLRMLDAAEQVDRSKMQLEMFEAVDIGDQKRLREFFDEHDSRVKQTSSDLITEQQKDENCQTSQQSPKSLDNGDACSINIDSLTTMTDDRGNTLLHIAAMRGFTAICVYLLERGCDPYRKNHAGQTCISLSSYQLRQLFSKVKPSSSQLKKISKQRVIRFEGPLLKKVRILGWKQIYVVLENGVILLFNNRRDSMNKSRRGYKYLESATCNPEPNDVGMFSICFPDRSRATFMVSQAHLSSYPTFKHQSRESNHQSNPTNLVELVRQRWIDSLRDHIQYSTNFIRGGLKLNDSDDDATGSDLASLSQLLPVDTIRSFIQEARAHYSILERHSGSLCDLIHSIHSSNRLSESVQLSQDGSNQSTDSQRVSTTTSNRLLDLIRPSRQNRTGSSTGTNGSPVSNTAQQSATNESDKVRNNSLTNEFIQDNWHCILFHLRLLVESTQNTRSSMDQALALMEHQEQLRQQRLQDQEERCRILEDSLHALARDHHELEKSLSMSQIYHTATARSMSISTDLNEYHDAFEDFDDEKTVTPNSMPSDEDLYKKIRDVMEDEEREDQQLPGGRLSPKSGPSNRLDSSTTASREDIDDGTDYDEEDADEDIRSNCSALTVETVSEQYISTIDRSLQSGIGDHDLQQLAKVDSGTEYQVRFPYGLIVIRGSKVEWKYHEPRYGYLLVSKYR